VSVGRWLFVTGAPRSGTTFAGLVLSTPVIVDYFHEPFNPDCGAPGADQLYPYVRQGLENEPRYRAIVESLQRYTLTLRTAYYPRDRALKRLVKSVIGSRGPFYLRLAKLNPFHQVGLVKDPTACLMMRWLATEFGFQTLMLVRHPVAFVASHLRLGWDLAARLDALRSQPALLDDDIGPEERALLARRDDDPVMQAAILWRVLHVALMAQAREARPVILTHEALSAAPLPRFTELFDRFALPLTPRTRRRIERLTSSENATEARGTAAQDFRRNSADLLKLRIGTLSAAQRRTIFDLTRDVASPWYDEGTFQLEAAAAP
jgi:hypothetical protein